MMKTASEQRLFLINLTAAFLALCWLIAVFFTLEVDPNDFKQFWLAAVDFMQGDELYATAGYNYPSLFAYLISPLTLFDLWHAQRIWFAINCCMLLVFIGLCIFASGSSLARRYWGIVILGMLIAPPTRLSLQLGQVSILLALLPTASFVLARRNTIAAGALLALSTVIKLYPAFIGLYYLLRGPRRVAYWALVVGGVLIGLTLLADGPGPYLALFYKMRSATGFPYASDFNISLQGFFDRLLTSSNYSIPVMHQPLLARILTLTGSAVVLVICLYIGRTPADQHHRLLTFNLWLCGMLLVSPLNGYYNLLLLLLPLLALLAYLEQHPSRSLQGWLVVATALLWIPPSWSKSLGSIYDVVHIGWGVLLLTPSLYGVVIYLVLIAVVAHGYQAQLGRSAEKGRSDPVQMVSAPQDLQT